MTLVLTDAHFGSGGTGSADGTHNGRFSGADHGDIPYVTSVADEIVVLQFNSEPNHTSGSVDIVGVVCTNGLDWQKRSSKHHVGVNQANTDNTQEIWWAHAPTAVSGVITVTLAATIDDAAGSTFSVSGCTNFTNPWDAGVGTPATDSNANTPATNNSASINTSSSDSIVFMFYGSPVNNNPGVGSGYTQADSLINNGGTNWSSVFCQYQNFSSPQSALSPQMNNVFANWNIIVDALSDVGTTSGPTANPEPVIVIST